jgi:hypothetical protein
VFTRVSFEPIYSTVDARYRHEDLLRTFKIKYLPYEKINAWAKRKGFNNLII